MKSTQKRKYNLGDYVLIHYVDYNKPITYAEFDFPYACSGSPVVNPNSVMVSKVIQIDTRIQEFISYSNEKRIMTSTSIQLEGIEYNRSQEDLSMQKIESEEQKLILEELVKVWEL